MQHPPIRRRPSRAVVAAAAAAATTLALTALLLAAQQWRAGTPDCTGVYVPDVPGSELARQWLCSYYEERQRRGASPRWPAAAGRPSTPGCEAPGAAPHGVAATSAAQQARRKWRLGRHAEQQEHKHLVLAAVGDSWDPGADSNRWLDSPAAADFAVVVVYYGRNASWTCPGCLHTFRGHGPKWQLLYNVSFSAEWEALVAGRDPRTTYLWLPDDDVVASSCDVSPFLRLMAEQQLLLAQMSICRDDNITISWGHLFQQPGTALRYTAFVEIMAPAVRLDFFQAVVRPTLARAYSGWGLDTVWAYLLHYSRDEIAVVDAMCMVHQGSSGEGKKQEKGASNYLAAQQASPFQNPWFEDHRGIRADWRFPADCTADFCQGVPQDWWGRATKEWRRVPLGRSVAHRSLLRATLKAVRQAAAAGLRSMAARAALLLASIGVLAAWLLQLWQAPHWVAKGAPAARHVHK